MRPDRQGSETNKAGARLADFKWGNRPSRLIISLLLLLILFLAAWRSINYISA